MVQFRVHRKRGRARVILARDLDHAEDVAGRKYPDWTDIYIIDKSRANEKCEADAAELEAAAL